MARPKKTAAEAAETAEKKPAAKKTAAAAKKTETKASKTETAAEAVETAAKKPAVKKSAAAAKKTETAAAEAKVVTKIQFGGCEYDAAEIAEKAKAVFKAESKAAIKTVNVYIKPEDNAAYFVVNDTFEGKIDL